VKLVEAVQPAAEVIGLIRRKTALGTRVANRRMQATKLRDNVVVDTLGVAGTAVAILWIVLRARRASHHGCGEHGGRE
jgi:hypothetical protein